MRYLERLVDEELLSPIEVKAGTKGSMQSMRIFLQAKQLDKGIRTSLENFGAVEDFLIYPLYAIGNVCRG